MKTIVFANSKKEALEKTFKWLEKNLRDGYAVAEEDVHLYLKNYKPEARSMVASGNYQE